MAVATKSGYVTARETLDLKAGDKFEKTLKLIAKPSVPVLPVQVQTPTPSKPCSKWLKHCK